MRIRTGIALAVLALTGAGCVDREAQKQAKLTEDLISDPTRPVRVAVVGARVLTEMLEVTGSITTGDDAVVGAKSGGRLVAVYVKDGDAVKAGQVVAQQETSEHLARVRQAQEAVRAARSQVEQATTDGIVGPRRSAAGVAAAEARLRQARSNLAKIKSGARPEERIQMQWAVDNAKKNLETAEKDWERVRRLRDEGALSVSEAERSELALMQARTAYESAVQSKRIMDIGARQEDIAAAEQDVQAAEQQLKIDRANQQLDSQYGQRVQSALANLRSAQDGLTLANQALSDATIRAPFDGRIAGKPTQVGTFVGPGAPVVRIIGVGGLYFEADVPEGQIAEITPGKSVDVKIEALGGRKIPGSVVAVNPLGSEVGRLYKVRVAFNESTNQLQSGMFATGVIDLRRIPGAIVVPTAAIVKEGKDVYVFVMEGDKVRKVAVTTGLEQGEVVQVLSGLSVGQSVVTSGQGQISDGTKVRVETAGQALKKPGDKGG